MALCGSHRVHRAADDPAESDTRRATSTSVGSPPPVIEKCRMAKATLRTARRSGGAKGHVQYFVQGDPTSTSRVVRTSHESTNGHALALRIAIERLYVRLAAMPGAPSPAGTRQASPAYRALEAEIRTLAAQHWALTE